MSIDDVRARLADRVKQAAPDVSRADLRALLADHAALASRLARAEAVCDAAEAVDAAPDAGEYAGGCYGSCASDNSRHAPECAARTAALDALRAALAAWRAP